MAVEEVVTGERRMETKPQAEQALDRAEVAPLSLHSGDHLTRYEFERRYQAMSHIKKAELIEGVVYVSSPVTVFHSEPHGQIAVWLGTYQAATPGVKFNDNSTVLLDIDNEVQPDTLLRLDAELGGTSKVTSAGYIEGPPELVAEIAYSSAAYDLHDKFKVYRRSGVQEYIVWQIYDNQLDWFRLDEKGEYVLLKPDEAGVIRSQIFPGLQLKVTALLEGNLASVLAELQQNLETPEHQAFVERLGTKK